MDTAGNQIDSNRKFLEIMVRLLPICANEKSVNRVGYENVLCGFNKKEVRIRTLA